jgi:hypothetical protein
MRTVLLSFVALLIISMGAAGQAGAVTVDGQSVIGRQVFVFFSASKTLTCPNGTPGTAFVNGDVIGGESISRTVGVPATRSNSVTVDVFAYSNDCTGASFGFGGGLSSGGLVGPGPLLGFATMNASLTVQDFDSGATMPVTVHLVVTASGPLAASAATTETHTVHPFTLTITRSANSNRPATVTGTFAINGDVFNLGGTSATISSNSNSTLTVTTP